MFSYFSAFLLGLIEGLTEFLPVSSTGHLLIAEHWLGAHSDFFNIVIQAGAICAVVLLYRERLWEMVTHLHVPETRDYVVKILCAFFVTVALGLPIRLAGWKLPETLQPIAIAWIIGGVWMLFCEKKAKYAPLSATVSWKVAIGVGIAQTVAGVFPGTSRSGAAIFLAMLLGLSNRAKATDFVFLVGIPTMFGASAYAMLEVLRHPSVGVEPWSVTATAFVTALVSGFVVVRWLIGYIQHHSYTRFAYYRIALGAFVIAWLYFLH